MRFSNSGFSFFHPLIANRHQFHCIKYFKFLPHFCGDINTFLFTFCVPYLGYRSLASYHIPENEHFTGWVWYMEIDWSRMYSNKTVTKQQHFCHFSLNLAINFHIPESTHFPRYRTWEVGYHFPHVTPRKVFFELRKVHKKTWFGPL